MMDIEKLIHCLQCCARVDAHNIGCDDCGLEYCGPECQQLCGTAATALSTLQAENEKLRAELEKVKAENATLSAAMLTIQKSDNLERMEVVYKMDYATALSQRQLCDVAWIVFRGLLQEDLKWRGQKED